MKNRFNSPTPIITNPDSVDGLKFLEVHRDNLQFSEPSNIEELCAKFAEIRARISDTYDPYLIGISEGIELVLNDLTKIVENEK
jgi:hypothetical protein